MRRHASILVQWYAWPDEASTLFAFNLVVLNSNGPENKGGGLYWGEKQAIDLCFPFTSWAYLFPIPVTIFHWVGIDEKMQLLDCWKTKDGIKHV